MKFNFVEPQSVGPFGWVRYGQRRLPYAEPTQDGEESVWDYPRPPKLVKDNRRVLVRSGETVIADTSRALRLLETASPPTFYISKADINMSKLSESGDGSSCEWKGRANYWGGEGCVTVGVGEYPNADKLHMRWLRDYAAFFRGSLNAL